MQFCNGNLFFIFAIYNQVQADKAWNIFSCRSILLKSCPTYLPIIPALSRYTKFQSDMKLNLFLRVFVFLVVFEGLYAQNPVWPDTSKALLLFREAKILVDSEKYDIAEPLLLQAIGIWSEVRPGGSVPEAAARVQYGYTLLQLGKFDDALEALSRARSMQEQLLPKNDPDFVHTLRLIGLAYKEQGMYPQAIGPLEKALEIARVNFGETSAKTAAILSDLGYVYLYSGRYEKSIESLEKALAIQQKVLPAMDEDIAGTCHSLGTYHKTMRKYTEAQGYFKQALDIRLKIYGEDDGSIAYNYSEIGQVCLAGKDFQQALAYFEKSNAIMIRLGAETHPDYGYVCNDLGRAYFALANYAEALRWQQKALVLFRSASKTDNGLIGAILLYIGRAQSALGDFPSALESIRGDLRILTKLYGPDYAMLYHSEAATGDVYKRWYLRTGEDSLLQLSRAHFRLAEQHLDKCIRFENFSDARRRSLNDAVMVFEQAISAENLQLKTGEDPAALENAWRLSEEMHGFSLFAAAQESDALHFSGIPDSLLDLEKNLKSDMNTLENRRQKLITQGGLSITDSLVLENDARYFAKRDAYGRLCTHFEQHFPEYFRLKYALENVTLAETQKMLEPQQTLLEYFTGDSSIFIFVLHQTDSRLMEIRRDFPLAEWIAQFRQGISGYYSQAQKTPALYEQTLRQYAQAGQNLYQKLVAPVAAFLTSEVIIIPGGEINYLPFEALLTAAPKDLSNFKTYPFWVNDRTVSYAYSATMLRQMKYKKHLRPASDDLLAFAPFFFEDNTLGATGAGGISANRDVFKPLPNSGEEIFRAKRRFRGRSATYQGQAATCGKFIELAGDARVLHLATHAKANEQKGGFSYLAFAPAKDSLDNELLFAGDLYQMSLNADLVVLSACETGMGELQRGEGVLSLARAFAYAGAKSVLTSLWSVNDQSTMQLMDEFYGELQAGKTRNVALAEAKRSYLAGHPGLAAHPFFWAGFVLLGDTGAIK